MYLDMYVGPNTLFIARLQTVATDATKMFNNIHTHIKAFACKQKSADSFPEYIVLLNGVVMYCVKTSLAARWTSRAHVL